MCLFEEVLIMNVNYSIVFSLNIRFSHITFFAWPASYVLIGITERKLLINTLK